MKDKLVKYVYSQFESKNGLSLPKDELTTKRIEDACQRALEELESNKEAEINLPFIMADASGPKHLNIKITSGILTVLEMGNENQFEQAHQNLSKTTFGSTNIDDIMSSSVDPEEGSKRNARLFLWVAILFVIAIGALAFFMLENGN